MKRVLVTGGAGFNGSHLCERLLALGNEVLRVDNFFTFRRPDIALAKATLHWEPTIPLRDGVGGRGNPLPAPMARCLPFTENIPIITKRI